MLQNRIRLTMKNFPRQAYLTVYSTSVDNLITFEHSINRVYLQLYSAIVNNFSHNL